MNKMEVKDIMQILEKEILWCSENPDKGFHKEYKKGFINGIIQSKYLIVEFAKTLSKEKVNDVSYK